MMADSAAALSYARSAAEQAATQGDNAAIAELTARWLEGEALLRLNRAEEAERLVSRSLAQVRQKAPGSQLHADLLRSQASLSATGGDYGKALAFFQQAYKIYEQLGEKRSEAIVLQNIGSLYSDARDYARVLSYYREADSTFPEDDALALSAHNNKGNALKELGRYDEAKVEFEQSLELAKGMGSPLLEARILTNIASTQYLAGQLDAASRTTRTGIKVANSGAPEWSPFLHGVQAQIAFARGDLGAAQNALQVTFAGQDLASTSPYFRDFHETAWRTYDALGQYRLALAHLAAFNRLDSQARDLSAKANNALLATRFEAANRELEITRLSAETQAKETELARAQNRLLLLSLVMVFAVLMILGAILTLRAVNRNRKAVQAANDKLTWVTQHDGLTGLFSRDHFRESIDELIATGDAEARGAMLLFVDLDRFKQVNDVFGHRAGDELLKIVADRFRETAGEDAHIGRLGGDEFAIVLPATGGMEDTVRIAEAIIARVSEPCHIDGHEMGVGASVGIAPVGADGVSTSTVMTNADLALYEAKRGGRGIARVYCPTMRNVLEERAMLEDDLVSALEKGEISLTYQACVDAERTVLGYEALIRWNHPTKGMIRPDVFLPIAEDKLLMDQIGGWVLRTACNEATTWPEGTKLAVNISASQLANGNFIATVMEALAASGLGPDRLILEMTESAVLGMDSDLGQSIARLADYGVSFALDDFGRGYSSLSYIEKFAFTDIKIDRDFVHSAASGNARSRAIVHGIVSLAASLDIDVTAEGIENEAQFEALAALGCNAFQGYYVARPDAHPFADAGSRKVA